jgi:DNA repair exonuclease SbcCD ATPase subunit
MHNGVSAAVTAMEQAVRRLDAALAKRVAAFRSLSDQHSALAAELRGLRDELQAARDEAAALRERADFADALRAELAQIHAEADGAAPAPAAGGDPARLRQLEEAVALRDGEIAALQEDRDGLRQRLDAALAAQEGLKQVALQAAAPAPVPVPADVAALKAELTAARAAQAEMQAFQSGIAARLEATMARLRQALDAEAAGSR